MVWKSKRANDPLGKILFPKRNTVRPVRSMNSNKASQPVPGNRTLATNLMDRAWNDEKEVHVIEILENAKTKATL